MSMAVLITQTTAMFTSFSRISSADSSEKQTTLIVQMYPEVCHAITDEYKNEVMKCPTTPDGWCAIADKFMERWNFPHTCGARNPGWRQSPCAPFCTCADSWSSVPPSHTGQRPPVPSELPALPNRLRRHHHPGTPNSHPPSSTFHGACVSAFVNSIDDCTT